MPVVFIMSPQGTFTPTVSGAIATVVWEWGKKAQADGVEPIVVSRRSKAEPYQGMKTFLVDYPQVPNFPLAHQFFRLERKLTGWSDLRQREFALRVLQLIDREGLDRFPLVLNNDPCLAVLLRKRFPKAFIVLHMHNQLECKPPFRRLMPAAVDRLTAVSDYTARWGEEYYGLQRGVIHTVYNGVDLDRYAPASQPPDGDPVLNFVGRTGVEKAPDLLLKAARLLARQGKRFQLQIVGSNHWDRFVMDAYQQELKEIATALERDGIQVHRPGHVDRYRLPDTFRKAHVHVVPSRWDEPFGLTTVEGMASGLATVASRTGGTPEVVGEAGLLFERDSEVDLADRLSALISDPGMRTEYARRARARAEEFSWQKSWQSLKQHLPA